MPNDEINQQEYDNQVMWTEAFAREQRDLRRLWDLMKEYPEEAAAMAAAPKSRPQ